MNPGYEAGGTYVLRVLRVIERLGPEDLCAVRRELEAACDGVTELAGLGHVGKPWCQREWDRGRKKCDARSLGPLGVDICSEEVVCSHT